jgi:hypothetical protein
MPHGSTPEAKRIAHIREKCKKSLFWTAWYLCDFDRLSIVLHYGLWLWYKVGLDAGEKRFLCLLARGHFKTSFFQIAGSVFDIINNPNIRILIVMHNLDEAKKKGRKLKSVLRSRAMRTYFGELVPTGEMGTTTEFSINRTMDYPEETITLAGMASGLVGGHYNKIVIDDGVEFKASQSASVMETRVEFLRSINPLFEDEDSILFIIGTLWPGGGDGYYETVLKNKRFYKLVLGCYCDDRWDKFLELFALRPPADDEHYINERVLEANRELAWQPGQPIFPERRTMEGLQSDLDSMGSFLFSHQMLNVLLDEGARRFHREDFRGYALQYSTKGKPQTVYIDDVAYPFSRGIVTVAMDPTGGLNPESDWCGVTACWWLPPMKLGCLLDWYHEKAPDPKKQIETMLNMGTKWNADFLIPEAGSMQVWVGYWLKQQMQRQGRIFRVKPFTPGGVRKGKRILDRFHPYVAAHQFYVLYPEHEAVVDHLVALNITPDGTVIGDSPALADTFPMHVEWWKATSPDRSLDPNKVWDDGDDRAPSNVHPFRPRYGLASSEKLRQYR